MHIVEEQEFCEKAEPAYSKVFDGNDVIGISLTKKMTSRSFIYPVSSSINDAIPINFIIAAAREIGDNGCYFYRFWTNHGEPDYYYASFDDLLEYYDTSKIKSRNYIYYPINQLPVAMYSETGQWGTIINLASRWGMLGGSEIFVNQIRQCFPKLDKRVFSFLYSFYVECNADGSDYYTQVSYSIKSDLIYVYGETEANRIIKMSPQELLENSGEDLLW